jgi:coenzyme PQQ synthesis protein D (PqqD)
MLKINRKAVIDEVWKDEVVILNLTKGVYYSLTKSGVEIWALLNKGSSKEQIVETLKSRYTGEIEKSVEDLLKEMRDEEMIVEVGGDAEPLPLEITEKRPFEPPLFQVFNDMEDLLLLDPIHETDEQGWPHIPEQMRK